MVYQRLQTDITSDISKRVSNAVDEAMLLNVIDSDTAGGLKINNPKPGNLYCLPKIHKCPGSKTPPPRPICNSKQTPTEKISEWVDDQLQPLVKELPSYIQDDNDFLRKIDNINETHHLPPDTLLVTWDVKSLYTNIPEQGGTAACRHYLSSNGRSINVIEIVMKFVGLILNCNHFTFGNAFFLQKSGTAMGTRMAPSYANLFMGFLETDLLNSAPEKPLVWYRYIDDVFFIWTHGREKYEEFFRFCNNNRFGMIFEVTKDSVSNISVPFLDVLVILLNGKLKTDLYSKPTDKFQYLNFASCHPYHQKANLPYGLALRIRRICSSMVDFKRHGKELIVRLRRRGYKLGLIKDGLCKAAALSREDLLYNQQQRQSHIANRIIFSTTYNPRIPHLQQKLQELQPILHASERCKEIFPDPPLIAYRRNRNLNDLLVSRRLPPDTEIKQSNTSATEVDRGSCVCEECGRSFKNPRGKLIHHRLMHQNKAGREKLGVGFHKCGDKRCNTCRKGTFGEKITITSTQKEFTLHQTMTCKSSNVIYCITCTKCWAQYIGETGQEIHQRQAGHLHDINTNVAGLPYVRHFKKCGIEHYTITGVEKLRSRDPQIRKTREGFYKKLFKVQIV